jgi:2-oxoglutarate dehydrogenase E2 component (dihydrolipoamide succinyltransferase)
MASEIKVPTLGESVTEATVATWFKKVGDAVERDESIVELETDKVTLEVNAPEAGVLAEIVAEEGADVGIGDILGRIGEGEGRVEKSERKDEPTEKDEPAEGGKKKEAAEKPKDDREDDADKGGDDAPAVLPAAAKLIEEQGLDPKEIAGTGKDGRITKGDVQSHLDSDGSGGGKPAAKDDGEDRDKDGGEGQGKDEKEEKRETKKAPARDPDERGEERVRMTRLRRRVAERLKEAQNTAAMLTTFNEADLGAVMDLRKQYRDSFEKKHGVRLGFMSFFVKACVTALKEIPAVNAEIQGDEIVYKNYYDIGVAVGTPQGLVVPVLRDADKKSFGEIEAEINDLGLRARDGKLAMHDLTGGTFTVSNGGVYGSLLSTPILNPPQSGILGMHKIQDRAMVEGGQVVVRPMMYLALSYDHRIVDGREAVTFLVRVKECIEDPQRIMLDM